MTPSSIVKNAYPYPARQDHEVTQILLAKSKKKWESKSVREGAQPQLRTTQVDATQRKTEDLWRLK